MALRRLCNSFGRLLHRPLLLFFVLLGVGGTVAVASPHVWAWYHFRAGRAALERYRAEKALDHFNACLKVWPGSAETHLLASRAARQTDDYDTAEQHLREHQRLRGGASEETAFEWALLRAVGGDLPSTESYLRKRLTAQPEDAPVVLEALIQGYLRMCRNREALACVDRWLQIDADNVRALTLKGTLYRQVNAHLKAIAEYSRVLELDPEQHEVRWRMACSQLEISRYDEALAHFEQIRRRRPDDPEVLVRIARCQNFLGKAKQARQTLAPVLDRDPDHGLARRALGEIALWNGELDEAERELRRAVDLMPADHSASWSLYQALKQAGKSDDARAQGKRAEILKDRLDRLSDLSTHKMTERPHDPALHCEMGKLYLEMGHKEMAERWLSSALAQDPRYRPAHAALADLYDARGDKEKADEHRRQAAP